MASFFIDDGAATPRPIRLSGAIAQGAAGTIHRVTGEPGIVAKLYKDSNDLPEYREKIAAMLTAPPHLPAFSYNGKNYVQIAWPTATVIDGAGFRGFVMPEVDFQESTELENVLQKSVRQRKQLPEFYGIRVLLAANLSALMAELHSLGHYMVDMKPMNMRFYPQAWYMAILDTDGFSINGRRRLPARQFSDDYIAPDAKGKKPEELGSEQDLFALAVIIFRLLNNGIHPYQGIDIGNYPTTLQERIFAGLYAYGTTGHRGVKPARSSVHWFLEDDTRALLDCAFQITGARPTAAEWRDHLNGLIKNKVLVKCSKDPKNHGHFSKGCGFCALEQRLAGARAAAGALRAVQSPGHVLNNLQTAAGTGSVIGRPFLSSSTLNLALAFIAIAAVIWGGRSHQQNTPTTQRTQPQAATNAPLKPVDPSISTRFLVSQKENGESRAQITALPNQPQAATNAPFKPVDPVSQRETDELRAQITALPNQPQAATNAPFRPVHPSISIRFLAAQKEIDELRAQITALPNQLQAATNGPFGRATELADHPTNSAWGHTEFLSHASSVVHINTSSGIRVVAE